MHKLKRGFLDTKRLVSIALNLNTRKQWFVEYTQCIGKALQELNTNEVIFEKEMADTVLYNGQSLSITTYVDDKVDIVGRRSYIEDIQYETYATYGYYDDLLQEWVYETDPNPTTLWGYASGSTADDSGTTSGYTWIREDSVLDDNPPMFGYNTFFADDPLIDSTGSTISDSYFDVIYTIEGSYDPSNYNWIREPQEGDRLIIYIHDDIFLTMTEDEKNELKGNLKKYIIAPYSESFSLAGYN